MATNTIHPKHIMEDYHRFREKMGTRGNDPDVLQELFANLYMAHVMAASTRRDPEATDAEIEQMCQAINALEVEWSRRYSYMIIHKIFSSPPEKTSEKEESKEN